MDLIQQHPVLLPLGAILIAAIAIFIWQWQERRAYRAWRREQDATEADASRQLGSR